MGEYRNTRGEKPPATVREKRSLRTRILIWLCMVILAVWAAGQFIQVPRRVPASGYATTSSYAEVRAPVVGQVTAIERGSGDAVKIGDVMVRLEDAVERAMLAEMESDAQRSGAELAFKEAELLEQHRERTNRIEVAAVTLEYARKRLDITTQLLERGLASSRDVMEDTYKVRLAEAEYKRLGETDFKLAERQLAVLRQTLLSRHESVARARANLNAKTIYAPIAGRLFRHTFYVGEVVRPDMVLFEIFGGDEHVLRLRVPERYATRVATNQIIRAQFRTSKRMLRRQWHHGSVSFVRDAIQAEGNQTYRVIYCQFDPEGMSVPPGTTADAQILVGRSSIWRSLFDL
jgi:multidrug efflux pump subunit AcrA (membrane-fusion protein)